MTSVLDLPASQGQRSASFTFTPFETISGRVLDDVHPISGHAPTLEHDATRTIKRRLSGLVFGVEDSERLDPLAHSLRVAMKIGGATFPLGSYLFADPPYLRTSAGRMLTASCVDRGLVLSEELAETFSVSKGGNIATALRAFAEVCGIIDYQVDGTSATAGTALTWPAGTAKAKVFSELAATGAYLEPWFTSLDVLRIKAVFDPAAVPFTFDYDDGPIYVDTITESNDLLTAPNRFKVIDNGASGGAAIVGIYDVPPSAPHSHLNLGRYVVRSEQRQGLLSTTQANEAARALGIQSAVAETYEFSVPPDPRHESFDVSRYRGANWLELSWSMTLAEGAPMRIKATKAFET